MFDLCVVGAGLIGSAAAKHASRSSSVCLVGPDEPTGKELSLLWMLAACQLEIEVETISRQ